MKTALISIKPEFAEQILDGTKRYEFRRRAPRHTGPIRFVIYESSPVRRIAGEMIVSDIIEGDPDYVWDKAGNEGGISRDRFMDYFADANKAHALRVKSIRRYANGMALEDLREAIHADFSPPQFMTWLTDERYETIRRGARPTDNKGWFVKSLRYAADQVRNMAAKAVAPFAPATEG